MTIDEAIAHAREVAEWKREMANGVWRKKLDNPKFPFGREFTKEEVERKESECIKCAEEHEQLAEWLEELKELRDMKDTITSNAEVLVKQGYNKAIDDFNNSIKEELDRFEVKNLDTCILFDLMDRKAEQLKAGGVDAGSI